MSSDKKAEGSVTLLNRGQRAYEIGNDAGGKARRHAPGTTMTYSVEEAEKMGQYKELVDISKLPGQVDAGKLKADNARMLAENAALKAQLESLQAGKESAAEEAAPAEGRKKK